ncbi:MAG: hypothetical protein M1569_03925 [Candidatus Marsarchaeota archaeon]|nr:hypothetical protein [Candidatus Marsarchaeota archaeon]MCL5413521.1 hypothetical protein [Candidatus Marsarchaeota archaeon]
MANDVAKERYVEEKYVDLYGEINVPPNVYNAPHKGYKHSMRTYVWITLLILGVMSALWFVLGIVPNAGGTIPPSFVFGPSDMFFHSIAIGITALIVYFVIMAFDLDKYEPNIDFPIAYRALIATILGAVAAFFYLSPIFNAATEPITDIIMFLALLFLADVGGALIVELYLLPVKLTGKYNPRNNWMGMFPRWKELPKWSDFRKMDSAYWLVLTAVVVTFVAGIMGFIALWVNPYHVFIAAPAFLNGYENWLGGTAAFINALVGSHSHVIGMSVILGVVAVVAKRFGVLDLKGLKRSVAKFGMWVSITGLIIMTVVFLFEAFAAFTPPLLFASNPGGPLQLISYTAVNGMASDDSTMFLASIGAMIMLIPLMLTEIKGRSAWKDPLRLSILATWVIAYIATPIEGFYIEFHEATLSGMPPDIVFGNLQYFALFAITMITLAFLAVDFFQADKKARKMVSVAGILVTLFALVTGFIYVFLDPGALEGNHLAGTTTWGYVFSFGLVLISAVVIYAMLKVHSGSKHQIPMVRPIAAKSITT